MKCIKCECELTSMFTDSKSEYKPEDQSWLNGTVGVINVGYGSNFDSSSITIAICDKCIENNTDKLIIDDIIGY